MPIQPSAAEALPALGITAEPMGLPVVREPIRGLRKLGLLARLWLHGVAVAMRAGRGPLQAVSAVLKLCAALQRQQWTTPTRRGSLLWSSQKFFRTAGRVFWDFYAPGWPSPALDRCIGRELDRVDPIGRTPGLNTTIIAITRRCALNCEHCFEWNALNRREALTSDDLHEILRRVLQRGSSQVFLSGGEPLQRFADLLSLAGIAARESDVWVMTSGLGLTAEKARRLREAGVTGLSISLDHWDADAHDRFRGLPGSHAAAMRAARHAGEAGLLVALSLCAIRDFANRADLNRYAETARGLGASFIQIFEPKALGHYAGREVGLGPAHRLALEQFCERINTDAAWRDYPTVDYLDWGARLLGCCGAGDRYAYIDTEGQMHACPFCRAPGLRVLQQDIDVALSALLERGCPASGRMT